MFFLLCSRGLPPAAGGYSRWSSNGGLKALLSFRGSLLLASLRRLPLVGSLGPARAAPAGSGLRPPCKSLGSRVMPLKNASTSLKFLSKYGQKVQFMRVSTLILLRLVWPLLLLWVSTHWDIHPTGGEAAAKERSDLA